MIPFIDLKQQYKLVEEDVNARFNSILQSCQFIMGPAVAECEKDLADYTGCKYVISCSSGTDALVLALMSVGIGPGDEVIVPGYSFIATAEAVSLVGARPIFVDVDMDYFNLDISLVENSLTQDAKAIMPVSLFGQCCDMDAVNSLAEAHDLIVIEDAAQSFGATQNGLKSCNLSSLACTSFFPAKPLGCYGDGGAVFTNSEELFEKLKVFRNHGSTEQYVHSHIGMNGRMDSLQCAVVSAKLRLFPQELQKRHMLACDYNEAFAELNGIKVPKLLNGNSSAWAQYTLQLEHRDEFREFMKKKGIPTAVYYPIPMYKQRCFAEYNDLELKNSDALSKIAVSLPMHPYMSESDKELVIDAVIEWAKNA